MIDEEPLDLTRRILQVLDERRERGLSVDFDGLACALTSLDLRVPSEVLNELAMRLAFRGGELFVPVPLSDFIATLAGRRPLCHVVDPWCQLGQVAAALAKRAPSAKVRAITRRSADLQLLQHIDAPVEWVAGNAVLEPQLLGVENDLVVSLPPFNAPVDRPAPGELATRLLELGCQSLAQEGEALFVLSSGSWMRASIDGWRDRLVSSGFALRACYWIPSGQFAPLTTLAAVLVHVSRGAQGDLFVAELPDSVANTGTVLENFAKRRRAPDARLGRWLPVDEFISLPHLLAKERLAHLGRRLGAGQRLADIATVRDWKPKEGTVDGAVLVPAEESPSRPAYVVGDRAEVKGRHVVIEIRDGAAIPEYLARYFTTDIGQLTREVAGGARSKQRLSSEALGNTLVYLPQVSVQRAAVEMATKIRTLTSELRELEDRLWDRQGNIEDARTALAKVNHEDRFEVWLETLPYPLATVLWLYVAQRSAKERLDTLLHFFEAYAELWATTLLSLFLREPNGRPSYKARVQSVLREQKQNLELASFGTWLTLVEMLAKMGRDLQESPDGRDHLRQQAALYDEPMLGVLLSKEVLQILRVVSTLRNTWKGHGGIVSEESAGERLAIAKKHLGDLRSVVGERWSRYVLYRMGSMTFTDGLGLAQVERVVGTRAPFKMDTIELARPADAGRLYFVGDGVRDAMPLLPFIRVMPSPKTSLSACYFYNRKTKEGVRFVSYHFAEDADVTDRFEETANEVASLSKPEGT